MAEPATKKKTSSTMPDWTKLPEELLQTITENLDNCFDVVHARSVCRSWRSTFRFPSCLLRPSYSLPTYPVEKVGMCSIEKVPLMLFRLPAPADAAVPASEYFVGLIGRDEAAEYMEVPSPLQCSLRVKLTGSDPTLMKMLDCQIFSLGHQYRMVCWDPEGLRSTHRNVAFLPLNKEGGEGGGGGGFVVLRSHLRTFLVLTSAGRRWVRLKGVPSTRCTGLVTFRDRFYAVFDNRKVFVINPYSLEATSLMPSNDLNGINYLIPAANDELFLVERVNHLGGRLTCRVSRLDEEAGRWVEVTDLGDLVLFVGQLANVSCSAKQLSDGCGVSGNSILFINPPQRGDVTYFHKYGPPKVAKEGVGSDWRISRENRVTILNKSPVLALRIES